MIKTFFRIIKSLKRITKKAAAAPGRRVFNEHSGLITKGIIIIS